MDLLGRFPVERELGVPEVLPDLADLGQVERAATADDVPLAVVLDDRDVATFVVGLGILVGAVDVGEHLPATDADRELFVRERLRVPKQDLGVVGELVATAWVGSGLGERPDLGDADLA